MSCFVVLLLLLLLLFIIVITITIIIVSIVINIIYSGVVLAPCAKCVCNFVFLFVCLS